MGACVPRPTVPVECRAAFPTARTCFFRVAFKPTATIAQTQQTVTVTGEDTELAARGRHDPCVLPRAVPMVEAMAALVLVDHVLRQRAVARE